MKKFFGVTTGLLMAAMLGSASYAETPSAKSAAAAADLSGVQFNSWGELEGLRSTIKIPEAKELIFDVSLQCGLYTYTKASSKKSVRSEDSVEAGINVAVLWTNLDSGESGWAHPNANSSLGQDVLDEGFPEGVTYCSRMQSLAATFQGDLLNCIQEDGTVVVDDLCLTEESVELTLKTLAAHAFNFYSMDLSQGTYEISVWANPECSDNETAEACDGGGDARAWIGMGSMVIDEVRFINK